MRNMGVQEQNLRNSLLSRGSLLSPSLSLSQSQASRSSAKGTPEARVHLELKEATPRAEVGKQQPTGEMQPATCFYK